MKGREQLEEILRLAAKKDASDIHLKAGIMPVIRKYGKLRPLSSKAQTVSSHEIDEMAFSILDEQQKEHYRKNKQIDLGYGVSGLGRFRINIFRQRGTTRMVIRAIPMDVAGVDDLHLPPTIKKIAELERGLVLVTGVTGSGKSTTLASMIDHVNRTTNKHIITIEDPIEYLIRDRKSIISQREIGTDSVSFTDALRSALRQDPDVILIGEMRDRETIEIALTAAETGHLVLSTLHTADARESIHRILSVFPPHQHSQIRYQLASVLKAVVSQRLARRSSQLGFVPAVEILMNNPRVAELIEDPARTSELLKVIEESDSWGMQSFDQSLMKLLKRKEITFEEALSLSTSPEDFRLKYSGVSIGDDKKKWNAHESVDHTQSYDSWNRIQDLELETNAFRRSQEADEDTGLYDEDDGKSADKIHVKPRVIKKSGEIEAISAEFIYKSHMSDMDMPKEKPRKSASHKLMDYLARRDHSERELRQKLGKSFSAAEVDQAIQYGKDNNWMVDPAELSERVAGQLHQKGKGFLYISQYLQKKGLPPVDKDNELEYKKALDLIEPERQARTETDRMIRKMVNRGFDSETVSRVLNQALK